MLETPNIRLEVDSMHVIYFQRDLDLLQIILGKRTKLHLSAKCYLSLDLTDFDTEELNLKHCEQSLQA